MTLPQEDNARGLKDAFRINQAEVERHVDVVVRETVEETLNELLEAEANQLCQAKRYERTPDRADTRAGSYQRTLQTKAGEVTLIVPRLRSLPFETQIIERYKRRESGGGHAWSAYSQTEGRP